MSTRPNELYRKSKTLEVGMLMAAKKCGDMLRDIRKIVGRWRFKQWVYNNFENRSYETASAYCRISENWDDPIIKDAMARGVVTSINKYLTLLRETKKREQDPTENWTDKQKMASMMKDWLRKRFAEQIKTLQPNELELLSIEFEGYFWPKWYRALRQEVVCVEQTPYPEKQKDNNGVPYGDSIEEHEERKRAVRRKTVKSGHSSKQQ